MKTLKQGDFIKYEDLQGTSLHYLTCFAHFYLYTDGIHLVFYEPQSETIYCIIKAPRYEKSKL